MKSRVQILFYAIIALAALGLLVTLFTDFLGMVRYLITTAILVAVVFYVFKRLSSAGNVDPQKKEQKAFLKAARQSRKRYKKKTGKQKTARSKQAIRRNPTHLTVIEGKKGKKKSRVFH